MDIKKIMGDEAEKPLDRLLEGGGFVGIFPKIVCIGDSLSSGEFQIKMPDNTNQYFDFFEYSWGKQMERITGTSVKVFAQGGMTAEAYRTSFAHLRGYWKREHAANAYIIALGVNDILNRGVEIGTVDDIDLNDYRNNKNTFIGNYAYIIQRYKEIQPEAKFFVVTIPYSSDRGEERGKRNEAAHNAICAIADLFDNVYLVDLYKYACDFDADFRSKFFYNGHMNPMGYLLIARMITSYIDYIIRYNLPEFFEVGLMGVDKP